MERLEALTPDELATLAATTLATIRETAGEYAWAWLNAAHPLSSPSAGRESDEAKEDFDRATCAMESLLARLVDAVRAGAEGRTTDQEKTENGQPQVPVLSRDAAAIRLGSLWQAPDDFDPHDFYGPCDGFHNGQCSVCRDLIYTLGREIAARATPSPESHANAES